jgi:hypothetical protein
LADEGELHLRDDFDTEREQRREFYALLALATDISIDRFLERTQLAGPLGLVRNISSSPVMGPEWVPVVPRQLDSEEDPYASLYSCLIDTAQAAGFPDIRDRGNEKLDAVLRRLDQIGPAVGLLETEARAHYTEVVLQRGLHNVFETGVPLLEVIEQLERAENPDALPSDIGNTARLSGTRIGQWASFGFDEFAVSYHSALAGRYDSRRYNPFRVEAFSLEETPNGRRLTRLNRPVNPPRTNIRHDERLGCPAILRLAGQPSPVEKIWERLVTICEQSIWLPDPCLKTSQPASVY